MTITFTVIKTAIVRLTDTETETLTVLVKMTSRVFVTEKESRMAILLYLETEDKLVSETETMGETLRVTVTEVTVSLTI